MSVSRLLKKAQVRRFEDTISIHIDEPEYSEHKFASGANLNRVLQRLDSDVDFLMITSFRSFDDSVKPPRPVSKSENSRTFTKLPRQMRSLLGTERIGAYWLVGHWTECSLDLGTEPMTRCRELGGEVIDSLEYSWLFTRDDEAVTGDQWLEAAVKACAMYKQYAFIIRLEGETTLRLSDGSVDKTLQSNSAIAGAWEYLAAERSKSGQLGFSELRKVRERGRMQPLVFRNGDPAATVENAGGTFAEAQPELKAAAYRVQGTGEVHAPRFFLMQPNGNMAKMLFSSMGVRYTL